MTHHVWQTVCVALILLLLAPGASAAPTAAASLREPAPLKGATDYLGRSAHVSWPGLGRGAAVVHHPAMVSNARDHENSDAVVNEPEGTETEPTSARLHAFYPSDRLQLPLAFDSCSLPYSAAHPQPRRVHIAGRGPPAPAALS